MATPEKIYNVSRSQLSIARHYGGINYNGVEYVYNPVDDSLTRADVLKEAGRVEREEKKALEKRNKNRQIKLF